MDDLVVAVEDADGEPVGAEAGPDVLDRVEFRGIGRQVQERDVVGDGERPGRVPSGPVKDEDRMGTGATVRAIPARRAFIASVLTKGRIKPAAAPRVGQTAPKMRLHW